MNRSTVVIELAGDAGFSRDLAAGGVFVPGCALRLADECDLLVRGANRELLVPARVVYVDDQRGAGLELIGFSTEMKAQLAELAPMVPSRLEFLEVQVVDDLTPDGSPLDDLPPPEDELALGGFSEPVPLIDLQALDDADDDLAVPIFGEPGGYPGSSEGTSDYPGDVADPAGAADAGAPDIGEPYDDDPPAHRRAAIYDAVVPADLDPSNPVYVHLTNAKTLPPDNAVRYHGPENEPASEPSGYGDPEIEPEPEPDDQGPREPGAPTRRRATGVHERLRGLTLASQLKMATSGEQHERIMLERLYGKNVWEALLRNPRLTAPEVARIARYGALPRVLLEVILGNNAWLQIAEVRRALLTNPRLGTDQIMKILRLTPKHELKLAAIQTAYPHTVRQAAKLLLRSD